MDDIIPALLNLSTTPSLLILSIVVGGMWKQMKDNTKREEARYKELQRWMTDQIREIRETFEARTKEMGEALDQLAQRLTIVEREFLPREEHYRDFSGWRTEIHRVMDRLDRLMETKR